MVISAYVNEEERDDQKTVRTKRGNCLEGVITLEEDDESMVKREKESAIQEEILLKKS